VTSLPELLGVGRQLAVTHQRPPRSRPNRLEPLRSFTRAPPRWPRPARLQQLGRRSSVISWEAPLSPARGTVARRNGFIQRRGSRVFGRPSGTQDRTQPAKLEIPFGHPFDKRGVSLPKSAERVRPVGLRSAIEGSAALGPGGVGRLEGHFAITIIASQRFKDAMRQPREAAIECQVTKFPD
jgi:hypothetical protein